MVRRICGEEVSPGMRAPDPNPKRIPTFRQHYINDEPVSAEEFERAAEGAAEGAKA